MRGSRSTAITRTLEANATCRHQTGQSYGIGRGAGRTSGAGVRTSPRSPMREAGKAFAEGHGEPHRHHPGVKIRVEPVFQAEQQLQPFAGVNESCGYVPDAAASAPPRPRMVRYGLSARSRCATAPALREISRSAPWAACAQNRSSNAWSMPVPPSAAPAAPLHEPQAVQRRLNGEQRGPLLWGYVVVEPQPEQRCGAQTDQCHVVFRGDGTHVGRPPPPPVGGRRSARTPLACPCWVVPRQINASSASGQRTVQQVEDDLPDAAAARAGRNALRLRDVDEGEPADRQEVPQLPVAGEEESPRVTRGVDKTVSLVPCRLVFAHDHRLTPPPFGSGTRIGALPLPVLPLGEFQRRAQAGKTGQRPVARIDLAAGAKPRQHARATGRAAVRPRSRSHPRDRGRRPTPRHRSRLRTGRGWRPACSSWRISAV